MLRSLVLAALVMSGCSVAPHSSPALETESSSATAPHPARHQGASRQLTQQVLDTLAAAVARDDSSTFRAVVSTADPGFADTSVMVWDNLRRLALRRLELTAVDEVTALSRERRQLLGAAAWVQQVRVRWQLPEESTVAEHTVWVTLTVEDGPPQLAGTTDGPSALGAEPLWWLEPVAVAREGGSVALSGRGSAAIWAGRAAAAARGLNGRVDAVASTGWRGGLVIEVPSSQGLFERVLGVRQNSYRAIAAVAWPEGPNPRTAAIRVVVNSTVTQGLSEEGVAVLLTHEATHVATRSPGSPAPSWLVEGYADYVAYDAYPRTKAAAAAAALADIRRHGPPRALPTDADFTPGSSDLGLSYARAWLACEFVADTFSARRLSAFYSEVDRGTRLGTAMKKSLGVHEREFTRAWRRYLRSRSEG